MIKCQLWLILSQCIICVLDLWNNFLCPWCLRLPDYRLLGTVVTWRENENSRARLCLPNLSSRLIELSYSHCLKRKEWRREERVGELHLCSPFCMKRNMQCGQEHSFLIRRKCLCSAYSLWVLHTLCWRVMKLCGHPVFILFKERHNITNGFLLAGIRWFLLDRRINY